MRWLTKKRMVYAILGLLGVTMIVLANFARTSRKDEIDRHRATAYLRRANDLEHLLRERVLQGHAFLLESYDPLVRVVQQSQALCHEMMSPLGEVLRQHRNGENDEVQNYCQIIQKKIEAVEDFKTKNSLLVNTIRYFPSIVASFRETKSQIRSLDIYNDVLAYCLQPTDERSASIEKQLTRLYLEWHGKTDRPQMQALLQHGSLALRIAMDRHRYESIIYSSDLQEAVVRLTDGYSRANDRREFRARYYKAGMTTFAALLMVALMILMYRLQISAESLTELNRDLESKVAKRTEDLSKALSDLELQQQILAHSTKMSALGEMAGGIAHEINTPLAAISLKAESMMFLTDLSEETKRGLDEIISIVERLAKIVTGLRRFSRDSDGDEKRPVSVLSIINETLVLCGQKFKNHDIEVSVDCAPDFIVECVSEQISQVLLNLLNNSYDAIQSSPKKWVRIEAKLDGDFIRLRIVDCGLGIPKELQDKIMQPFFTTKEVGHGTGIGLSISKGIARRHGGTFEYDASASNTTFELKLPAVKISVAA